MNRKIRKMKERLERAGGTVYVNPDVPDEIQERFLKEILQCPDCREAIRQAERKRWN